MKIVTYSLLGLLVVVSCVAAYYASEQKTTVEVLVSARHGLSGDVSGMEATNKELEIGAAAAASTRKKSTEDAKQQLAVTQEAVNKLMDAKRDAEATGKEKEEAESKLAEAEKRKDELEQMQEEFTTKLHAVPGLEDADAENAVDTLKEKIEEHGKKIATLLEETKKVVEQREKLNTEVSSAESELQKKREENDKFADTYRNNGAEYTIDAVDTQWHFVIFNAEEDNGLIPGDTTLMLVHRDGVSVTTLRVVRVSGCQVVAEYDEKSLPRGVCLEIGDRVLRKVPAGS